MTSVCFLSSMHPPFDKRVFEKEAKALAAAGYTVTHLCPDDGPDREAGGVRIRTFRKRKGLIGRLQLLPALYRMARQIDADVYHCNEFDSFLVGIALRLFARKKCVLDVHEFFAHDLADKFPAMVRPLVFAAMTALVRLSAYGAHAVILANAHLMPDYAHLPRGRVTIAENFSSLSAVDLTPRDNHRQPPYRVVHIGILNKVRGALQVLDALHHARHKDVEFYSVGGLSEADEVEFRRLAAERGLEGRVHLIPWMSMTEMMTFLKKADIGLILFQKGPHAHAHALPHKLFDYMVSELAVIAPDFSLRIGDIVRDTECGVLVDTGTPEAIAHAIDALCDDPARMVHMGASGREAVQRRYHWEREVEALLGVYRVLKSPNH